MRPLTIAFFTGRTEVNKRIGNVLSAVLKGFAIDVVDAVDDVDILVCTPEFISNFQDKIVLALTDSADHLTEHDCVVEYTPFPITEDDYERLEWRIITVAQNLRYDDDIQD